MYWLSLTFGLNLEVMDADVGLDQLDHILNADHATHVKLFREDGRRQFGSPPPLTKLIRFINKGGEPLLRRGEQLTNILISVDKKQHPGPERVKETINFRSR